MYVVLTILLVLVFLPIIEELMGWRPRAVTRARARVIGVNCSEFLTKGKEI